VKRLKTTVLPDFLENESFSNYHQKLGSRPESDESSSGSPEKKKRKMAGAMHVDGGVVIVKDNAPHVSNLLLPYVPSLVKSNSNSNNSNNNNANVSSQNSNNNGNFPNNNNSNNNSYVKIERKPSDVNRIKTESQIVCEIECLFFAMILIG
jgi:hypothetical protein